MKKQEKFLMRVNNDKEGRNFIHSMKRNLNSNSYGIITKYSGPRPAGTSQHSTSRENATSIRIYVESKLSGKALPKWEGTPDDRVRQIRITESLEWDIKQAQAEGRNAVLHEQVNIKRIEAEKKVLEAKLVLLTTGLQNSSKYGNFVRTVNGIETLI